MRNWRDFSELCELFGVNTSDKWADIAVSITQMGAIMLHFTALNMVGALEREYMREMHVSPLVFWSQLRRVLRPLVDAGGDTLRALGLPVEGDAVTVHQVLLTVADVTADDVTEDDREMAEQIGGVLGI